MALTYADFLSALGLQTLPARWEELFPSAAAEFDACGCFLTESSWYERLHERYGMLDGLLEHYKAAAAAVKKNEALSLLLLLLAKAQEDRACIGAELKQFAFPKAGPGDDPLAFAMLGALAITAMADYCHGLLRARHIPQHHIDTVLRTPEVTVRKHLTKTGQPACEPVMFLWNQNLIDGKLFRLGRLEIHLLESFGGCARVFRNAQGETVSLAEGIAFHRSGYALGSLHFEDPAGSFEGTVTEDESCYEGHLYRDDGTASPETVRLLKSEWQCVLSREDPVIKLHIPAGGGLTEEAVEDALRQGKDFAATYFPDFRYKAFSCYSWLCDPQIIPFVGADSNIGRFCRRFRPLTVRSSGRSVFRFVFDDEELPVEAIPENTRLSRALKQHYQSGKAVYDMRGFFF